MEETKKCPKCGEEMEEERRLMYVGITRAMQRVYLIFTHIRMIFGSNQANPPSRFLNDIPAYLVNNNQDIIIDSKKNNLESQENDDLLYSHNFHHNSHSL